MTSEPVTAKGDGEGPTIAPYGAWASLISAHTLAQGAVDVSELRCADRRLYWLENRPDQQGRLVVMTGDGSDRRELTPEGFNVRTRVHEYGGAPFLVVGRRIYFSNFIDQQLYLQEPGQPPVALTPKGYRYADCVAAPGGGLIAVREDHTDPARIRNAIVALSGRPGDAGRMLFGDSDFVAYPRLSRDGRRLAWIAWDHPNMPWDDTRLHVADLGAQGLTDNRVVAGAGGDESVTEPQWGEDGALYFMSDRTGFWNLHAFQGEQVRPVLTLEAEFAGPLWRLGQSNYALIGDNRIAAIFADAQGDHLVLIQAVSGAATTIPLPFNVIGDVQALDRSTIALTAASGTRPAGLFTVNLDSGAVAEIRQPASSPVEESHVSVAQSVTYAGLGGNAHALYYPPVNGGFVAPTGEKPPLIVQIHGGPTGRASRAFALATQYWTSRGFAVLDVDHGGSAGYGRAYRRRLNGQWGIVDVQDVIAAAKHVIDLGWADPGRIAIHGGSAGGFTVLSAMAQSNVFKAGASYYGVTNLEALLQDTHKFESRYLDNLIGPYPETRAAYVDRSPVNQLDRLRAPLIIFQGSDDPIVPPGQAHQLRDALRDRGQPVAYMEFAGESHGFRRTETLVASKEAELYFYSRIFGFVPADRLPGTLIENFPAG